MDTFYKIVSSIVSVALLPFSWFAPIENPPEKITEKVVVEQVDYTIQLQQMQEAINQLKQIVDNQKFGGTQINFISGTKYRLAGSGVGTTDTSITLSSLTFPVSGTEISMSDFGSIGYATLEPNTSKKELISFTGISQDATSTQATLSGVIRGLTFNAPYNQDTSLRQTHSGGAIIVFSNPPQLYNRLAAKDNDETIYGNWVFSSTSMPRLDAAETATTSEQFATKRYVDNVTNAGVATATEAVGGKLKIATQNETASSTYTGANDAFALTSRYATSSPGTGCTNCKYVAITENDGKLNQSFLDLADNFTFSASTTFQNQVNVASSTTINSIKYVWPLVQGASSTFLTTNGSGSLSWNTAGHQLLSAPASQALQVATTSFFSVTLAANSLTTGEIIRVTGYATSSFLNGSRELIQNLNLSLGGNATSTCGIVLRSSGTSATSTFSFTIRPISSTVQTISCNTNSNAQVKNNPSADDTVTSYNLNDSQSTVQTTVTLSSDSLLTLQGGAFVNYSGTAHQGTIYGVIAELINL